MKITYKMLQSKGACESQAELFLELFPAGIEPTLALCIQHAHTFDWGWAVTNLLAPEGRAAFEAIHGTALVAYRAINGPARAAYKAIQGPAWGAFEAAEGPEWATYEAINSPARAAYEAIQNPALKVYEAIHGPALKTYEATCAEAFFEAWRTG